MGAQMGLLSQIDSKLVHSGENWLRLIGSQ